MKDMKLRNIKKNLGKWEKYSTFPWKRISTRDTTFESICREVGEGLPCYVCICRHRQRLPNPATKLIPSSFPYKETLNQILSSIIFFSFFPELKQSSISCYLLLVQSFTVPRRRTRTAVRSHPAAGQVPMCVIRPLRRLLPLIRHKVYTWKILPLVRVFPFFFLEL